MNQKQFVIIIWHQAGGRDNNATYYTWNDSETEAAYVFDSKEAAEQKWKEEDINEIHAGFIVECTTNSHPWI